MRRRATALEQLVLNRGNTVQQIAKTSSVLILGSLMAAIAIAQSAAFPAPRFPPFIPRTVGDQQLLEAARALVGRAPDTRPGYAVKAGEKVLMVVKPLEDPRIVEALTKAIREAHATVDVFAADVTDIIGTSLGDQGWGYLENPLFHYMRVHGRPLSRLLGGGQYVEQTQALVAIKGYNLLIADYDGYLKKPTVAGYRWEDMPGPTVDEFMVAATTNLELPGPLYDMIDALAWKQWQQARRVHVTDPEGTDVRWNLPADIAQIVTRPQFWRAEHLCMPDYLRGGSTQKTKTYADLDMTGVIAGTVNHIGVFPRIQVLVRGSRIERIDGGGRFGEEWRKVLKEHEAGVWPYQPGPGFGWIQECGLGRQPTAFRPRGAMHFPAGTMNERRRSGVLHWAFGVQSMKLQTSKANQYIIDNDLPDGHLDVHNNFPTITLETADGREILFMSKGRLQVLDDPNVRQLAHDFGDPDILLTDAWIPPVPGINVAGNYERDYAADPASWIVKEDERFFGKSSSTRKGLAHARRKTPARSDAEQRP